MLPVPAGASKATIIRSDDVRVVGLRQRGADGQPRIEHLSFDPVTDSYTYVWKTDKAWNGCRALLLTFRDGRSATALFELWK
jgi:hypothetical protein